MSEFIRLVSRIINLSQVREISFEHCEATIHWQNGDSHRLVDMDACILLEHLEKHYDLMTEAVAIRMVNKKAAGFWEVAVPDD